MALRLKPPRLMAGKTGWRVFGASLGEGFLRLSNPDSSVVSVYLQDGLHAASFLRRHKARHEIHYDFCEAESADVVFARRMKDWVFGMRCVLHVASSAIKWGRGP